ncbi:MAG: hypothetical protein WAM85_18285 [Terracidiphilus sp.]
MEKWAIIIAAIAAFVLLTRSIYHAASVLGYRLDELHEKVDELKEKIEAIEEKLDEIEANQNGKRYANPIDID